MPAPAPRGHSVGTGTERKEARSVARHLGTDFALRDRLSGRFRRDSHVQSVPGPDAAASVPVARPDAVSALAGSPGADSAARPSRTATNPAGKRVLSAFPWVRERNRGDPFSPALPPSVVAQPLQRFTGRAEGHDGPDTPQSARPGTPGGPVLDPLGAHPGGRARPAETSPKRRGTGVPEADTAPRGVPGAFRGLEAAWGCDQQEPRRGQGSGG